MRGKLVVHPPVSRPGRPAWVAAAAAALAAGLMLLHSALGQQVHRNGFETREPAWLRGSADTVFQELRHLISDQSAHSGQFAELLQLTAERGSFIHYYYPTGRAPIVDELSASVFVRANRPGVQLLARVVLPRERNPHNLDEPLTTLLRGDIYQVTGRWQRLEIRRPVKLAREQQHLMRAELQRDINFDDAYIDQLILNVYTDPGPIEVWIDDLELGPVFEQPAASPPARSGTLTNRGREAPHAPLGSERAAIVELAQDHLQINHRRFFIRGIRHTDTPLKALRDAGFNAVWFDASASPGLIEEAVNLGLWLVPSLPADGVRRSPDEVAGLIAPFLHSGGVLFWDLGGGLLAEQAAAVEQTARLVRQADIQRPVAADIWDGHRPYSRFLDMMGVHRWPLMTGLELPQYREWLDQRRRLARPGMFLWTWIQTHLPEWYTHLVYNQPSTAGFDIPIGPQPEQIRLLAYNALAAGSRGLAFWSDRFLADSHQGRDRLLALALINLELQMLEPFLTSLVDPPTWIETSNEHVKAAVLRTERGVLVLPIWQGKGSQFVAGQAAAARLSMVVPQVPLGTQAWEITPGDVRTLPIERVLGGMKVTLPEFGLTSAVLFTSDLAKDGLVVRLQDQCRRLRKMAAQWAHDLAVAEMDKVLKVEAELERQRHVPPDAQGLKDNAQSRLRACVHYWNNGDYRQAYEEAQRVLRPVRILMRAQWEEAVRGLDSPVASPYAVSFFTLPQHWRLMDEVQQSIAGDNLLPDGGFETAPGESASLWIPQEITSDDVELAARRVTDKPREGKQCLLLEITAPERLGSDGKRLPAPAALERTYLAIHSPAVQLAPGTLIRISGHVRIPRGIAASVDGALFFDSAGGEPLAIRLTRETDWKKFTLYRRVPPSGRVHVTLALTGIGSVYFDDIRIEALTPRTATFGAAGSASGN